MNKDKLFTINFIVQAVITATAQIVNIIHKIKTQKSEDNENKQSPQ